MNTSKDGFSPNVLQDGYDATILIDAYPDGKEPGTVSVVEPKLDDLEIGPDKGALLEPHGMHPMNVFRMGKGDAGTTRTHSAHWL
jgi:Ni,Fe-hydrogenase maturation factor